MSIEQKIANALTLPLAPFKRNAPFFVFMYALGLICTYAIVPDRPRAHAYEWAWAELFVDVYAITALISLPPHSVRVWIRRLCYLLAYATAIVDLYCYAKFDSTLTPTMLLLVGETNGDEASEFISSYLTTDVLFSCVGYVLLLGIVHLLFSIFARPTRRLSLRYLWKEVEKGKCGWALRIKQWWESRAVQVYGLSAAGLVVVVTFAVCCADTWHNKVAYHRLMSYKTIGEVEHELTKKERATQYQPLYRLAFSIYANELTAKQLVRLKKSLSEVRVDSCSFRSKKIVLIIGESYNRHHASMYGYDKPTTPRQQKRFRRGELMPFTDVVSPWNLTSYVFKHLFSLYTVGDKGDWCDYPLFPEVFRKAGYHVTFMTNQFLPQAKEAVYDFSGGFFLNDPELSAAQFDTRNTRLFRFDNGLVCDYDKLKDQGEGKPQLIIFHLKGQHVDYKSRCPSTQRKFNADDYKESRPDLDDKERKVLSEYDNAILYNDSIVDAIIRKFEKDDAIVVYVPDHGEECYEGDTHFYGRMHSAEVTARLAHAEFDIPMWIWCSRKYRRTHRDIYTSARRNRKKPFMTDAVAHVLMYLAGIESPQYRPDMNILGDSYNDKRERLLKHQVDYNELIKKEAEQAAKKKPKTK